MSTEIFVGRQLLPDLLAQYSNALFWPLEEMLLIPLFAVIAVIPSGRLLIIPSMNWLLLIDCG